MIDRLLSLVMAVCLALLIWLYARSRDQELASEVQVPVEVVLSPRQADHYSLEYTGARQVAISFSGPAQRLRELHMMQMNKQLQIVKTITVPDECLGQSRYTSSVVIEPGDVHVPQGLTPIVPEGRNLVPVMLHRLVERRLPVRFDSVRDGPAGVVMIEPTTVLVRGPQDVLDRTQTIPTRPSDLPARPPYASANVAAIGQVPMVEEIEGRPVRVTPSRVTVRVPGQARKTYELTDVQVQFLCPPNFHLRPKFIDAHSGKVTLKLVGPVMDEVPKVQAFIDLSKGKFVSGLNHEPLQLQLPREFQLAHDPPRVVAFELLPGDFTPDGLGMPAPTTTPTTRE